MSTLTTNEYGLRTLPPGMYLDLPMEDYIADPSLHSHGIKDLLVSPLAYWTRSAFNPNRPPDEDTEAKARGTAYHKLVLEGDDAFQAAYCVAPSKADFPGALDTMEEMRTYAETIGAKKGKSKADLCDEIRQREREIRRPPAHLWLEIMDRWNETRGAREPIKPDLWAQLRMARLVIDRMPSVKDAFKNGLSEVSLFWVRDDGVPMKARLDYLNTEIIDLKTFANIMDKDIEAAVYFEITRNRYHIQPAVYRDGLREMKRMYLSGEKVIQRGTVSEKWLDEVMREPQTRFFFAFIMTGWVPEFLVREWSPREGQGGSANSYWQLGVEAYAEGVQRWRMGMEHYGQTVPWVTDRGLAPLQDHRFPAFFLDQVASSS